MILNRVGKLHPSKGKRIMAYKFGGGLYTADFLRDKNKFKNIIEQYLKTK